MAGVQGATLAAETTIATQATSTSIANTASSAAINAPKELAKAGYKLVLNAEGQVKLIGDIPMTNLDVVNVINPAKNGWKVGQSITNFTAAGRVPSWSAVRQRFWKNENFYNYSNYDKTNILRMEKGLAPQYPNSNGLMESMELHHHITPQRNGGLFEFIPVTRAEHIILDPFRK